MIEPTSNLEMGGAPEENESWKNEVASRLDTYRTKSKRKLSGEFSMRFNFDGEPARPRQQICGPIALPPDPVEEAEPFEVQEISSALESDQQPEQLEAKPEPAPEPPRPPLRPSVPFKRKIMMEANVIEFPRLFPAVPLPPYSIADSITASAPRILDAPEIAQPLLETPILDGMRLEHYDNTPAPELEFPLQVAPVRRRVYAALADLAIVLLATALFSVIADKMLPGLSWTKPMLGAALLVPAAFWAMYQYMFIVYGAGTPGMKMSHLSFRTFKGAAPNRRQRRMRLIGMALSCSSLMLGFFWAYFDEDTLCWHDRISRTYIFQPRP